MGLPTFRYHPNPLETGAFEESKEGVVCDCCAYLGRVGARELRVLWVLEDVLDDSM